MDGIGEEVWIGLAFGIVVLIVSYLAVSSKREGNTIPSRGRGVSASRPECAICIDYATFAVETNCGHVYCGVCLLNFYELGSRGPLETPTCPYCRQSMTVLLPYFSESERTDQDPATVQRRNQLLEKLKAYNRLFSGSSRTLFEQISDLPFLVRHLWRYAWTSEGISYVFRMRALAFILLSAVYFLSPVDLIPESVFGLLGLIDDVFVSGTLLLYGSHLYRSLIAQDGLLE